MSGFEIKDEEQQQVMEWLRKNVSDWDDEVVSKARFKAFSGQRSDWEHNYLFWRDLILNLARHLRVSSIRPSQVKKVWFNRGGLTPLCIDQVLLEMCNAGDIYFSGDLVDPRSGQLTQVFKWVVKLTGISRSSPPVKLAADDQLIITYLLREKAEEVVKVLSDNHWGSSCIVTMRKFQEICGGPNEFSVILSHLSDSGKLKYLVVKKDNMEGVKVSLSQKAIVSVTSLDYDVLRLTCTSEKLQQQLNVIDQRYDKSKKLALASLKSGHKTIALRHARELKLSSQSRERCTGLLNRVEEVLRTISDAKETKEVSEVIRVGAKAMKENNLTVEEVQNCLDEVDECIYSQKQVEELLESSPTYAGIEDEDLEDELEKLELEVGEESSQVPLSKVEAFDAEALSSTLSGLKLVDNGGTKGKLADNGDNKEMLVDSGVTKQKQKASKPVRLEAA